MATAECDLRELVRLPWLMALTEGREEIAIALLDGPVARTHSDLVGSAIRDIGDSTAADCVDATSIACRHGTFVAGLLSSRRDTETRGICPGCTLLVRPIYSEAGESDGLPGATANELAQAIAESIDAGARLVNVSGAIPSSAITADRELNEALGEATRRGVLVVAAAGNQGKVGRSGITGHPWVVAVVPYGRDGRPTADANLGRSVGRYGVGAPAEDVISLDSAGGTTTMSGSSFAAPFVTGTAALLWSLVPAAPAEQVRVALTHQLRHQRSTITPPLLDATAAYEALIRPRSSRKEQHGEHAGWTPGASLAATSAQTAWVHQR